MKRSRSNATDRAAQPAAGDANAGDDGRTPPWQIAASVVLALHMLAVFWAPFAFASQSQSGFPSPLAAAGMQVLGPYIDALFLNHGYFFFAPNPGPSHLVRYEVRDAAGGVVAEGRFPDLNEHRPRLLYHRHFMLSESLNTAFVPPPPAELATQDPAEYARWSAARRRYEAYQSAFESHLAARHGGASATVRRVEHRQPTPAEWADGWRLDDARLYVTLPDEPPPPLAPLAVPPTPLLPAGEPR